MIGVLIFIGIVFILIKFKIYIKIFEILRIPYDAVKKLMNENKSYKQSLSLFNKMRDIEFSDRKW